MFHGAIPTIKVAHILLRHGVYTAKSQLTPDLLLAAKHPGCWRRTYQKKIRITCS